MVGKIYLAKIYFTDLSDYKIRPVLVLKMLDEDCICLQLSSQIKTGYILINNQHLSQGKLKKESMVVVPKNFTLHKSILYKYIGTVDDQLFKNIFEQFCKTIGCQL